MYEFRCVFRRNMGYFSWDEFIEILLNNMRNKVYISENEVCGLVGITDTYICIDRDNYIVIPLVIGEFITPFEILVLKNKPEED